MSKVVIDQLRIRLREAGVAGFMLSSSDNVAYVTGYESVMDGWRLTEPISAVFVPASPDLPVTLFLPEASLIGLVVAAREEQPIVFAQEQCIVFGQHQCLGVEPKHYSP